MIFFLVFAPAKLLFFLLIHPKVAAFSHCFSNFGDKTESN